MRIDPSKRLELKSSFLSEAISLKDDTMLLLKLFQSNLSTSNLLNTTNLSKPVIYEIISYVTVTYNISFSHEDESHIYRFLIHVRGDCMQHVT